MNKNAIIRVDASHKIGIGHLKRVVNVTKEVLLPLGFNPYFIFKGDKNSLNALEGFFSENTIINISNNLQNEISVIDNSIKNLKPKIIITDLPYMKEQKTYEEIISNRKIYHMVFDDLFLSKIKGNCIVNSSIFQNDLLDNETKYLTGCDYVIVKDDFLKVRKNAIKKNVLTITITFGGSDPKNYTFKTLCALMAIKGLNINVIIGHSFKEKKKISDFLLKKGKSSIFIYNSPKSLASILSKTDIAFISGGITMYEASYLGLPSVVLCQNKEQNLASLEFSKRGVFINLGYEKISKKNIIDAFFSIFDNYTLRKKMSRKGKQLVDGKGVLRIKKHLTKQQEKMLICQ